MKKIIIAGSILLSMGVAHAGLLDSVTSAAVAANSAQSASKTTTASATTTSDAAVTAMLTKKLQAGTSTKTQVKKKLGTPKTTKTENGKEVWTYDLSSVSKKLSTTATLAKALGQDTTTAEKTVQLTFNGDVLENYTVK